METITLNKLPPVTPIRRAYNDTKPCMYCGSTEDTCSDIEEIWRCPSMHAKRETDKILEDMRAAQNYKLST